MDNATAERLTKVHPFLSQKIAQLISILASLNLDVRVVQGLRTFAEQDALFAKGRTKPGKRVTNARAGQSNHNYGLAVDLCPFVDGKADWDNLAPFKIIGREAKKLGLEWGGDWKFVDMPHVQLPGMSVKECQYAYSQGGLQKVWERMNQILKGAKPSVFVPTADDLLEFGDKGAEVKKLQQDLASLGFLQEHEIDADFGKITKRAVIAFQRTNNLTADGIVGEGTKAKLKQVLASKGQQLANIRENELPFEVLKPSTVSNSPDNSQLAVDTPDGAMPPTEAETSDGAGALSSDSSAATETTATQTTVEQTPNGTTETTVQQNSFQSETKELPAPAKEGSTKTAVATTAAGWSLAALPMLIWGLIQSAYQQGQIDLKAIFDLVIKFYAENTRFIFYSIFAVIGFLAMKKIFKQLSFIVQMIINAIPWLHDIKIIPNEDK